MTASELATAAARSSPPREVKIAICLQAMLFLLGLLTGVVAYIFLGEAQEHPIAAAAIIVLFAGIWLVWLYGLWQKRNWVRWLTIISNVIALCLALHIVAIGSARGQTIVSCIQIAILVSATIMFLHPVVGSWYRRSVG